METVLPPHPWRATLSHYPSSPGGLRLHSLVLPTDPLDLASLLPTMSSEEGSVIITSTPSNNGGLIEHQPDLALVAYLESTHLPR